ncbi:uncharacterized protein LOC121814184 [Haplochromis burtoni]|uniref:uncharacterized protein LOC121814184 n=1 Tax=Haplochromis burtoni TaxID=8153 RepID=UPI001C2DC332|nr:uncharacterized protein LOC121814184 [Haplochromis burtoni]
MFHTECLTRAGVPVTGPARGKESQSSQCCFTGTYFVHSVLKKPRHAHPGSLPRALSSVAKHMKKNVEKQSTVCHNAARGDSRFHGCDDADEPVTSLACDRGDGTPKWRMVRAATTRGRQNAIFGGVASEPSVSPHEELGHLHSVSMGAEDIGIGLQAAIQCRSTTFQRIRLLSCSGRVRQFSPGGNFHLERQRSYKSCPSRGNAQWILFKVFPCAKERGKGDESHSGSPCPEPAFKDIQVQDVDARLAATVCMSGRLVHINQPEGCLFPHPHISPTLKVSEICFPGDSIRVCSPAFWSLTESKGVCEMHRGSSGPAHGKEHIDANSMHYFHRARPRLPPSESLCRLSYQCGQRHGI